MLSLAGRAGDGLIGGDPSAAAIKAFRRAGGEGKTCMAGIKVCWADTEEEARSTAHQVWPMAALPYSMALELPLPAHFEEAAARVREEDIARRVVCGPDPVRHRQAIQRFLDAGYDHIYVHQIGPHQAGFFKFYEREVLPYFEGLRSLNPQVSAT